MNPRRTAEGLARFGVETAVLSLHVTKGVGQYVLNRAASYLDGGPDIVESRLAEMPLNEARVASQLIRIADKQIEFPNDPITEEEVVAKQKGRRLQKAMRRSGFNRLGRAILYAEANPLVPDEITDEVVAIATKQQLDPERLDEAEFEEMDKKRASKVLMQRQGNLPPFSILRGVRALFRP